MSGNQSLYGSLQSLSGARLTEAHHAGDVIDYDVLRTARENGIALPSAGQTERSRYHGAVVFDPEPGVHRNVCYPDYSSLYPIIMIDVNASPETAIGVGIEALRDSEYTREEVRWSFIDPRPVKQLEPSETYSDYTDGEYKMVADPQKSDIKWRDDWDRIQEHLEPIFFEPPEINQGILPSRAETYIEWNNRYTGAMYSATKRQRNCFTPDTEVLTPDGIQDIRELTVGDTVYSLDPDTMEMECKPVTDVQEYSDYRGDLVDFENTYVDFSVTPNHRMLVQKENSNCRSDGYQFIEAGDLDAGSSYSLPSDWSFDGGEPLETVDLSTFVDDYEVLIDTSVHGHTFADELGWYPERRTMSKQYDVTSGYILDGDEFEAHRETIEDLSDDIYIHAASGHGWVPLTYNGNDVIELLCWYVTEGNVYTSERREYESATRGECKRVGLAQEVNEHRVSIQDLLVRMNLPYSVTEKKFTISNTLWHDLLVEWAGADSYEKRLPEWLFNCSHEQLELAFETLIAGDGDQRENSYRYTTASEELRDDVMRLAAILGRNPRYTQDSGSWRIWYSETENTLRPRRSQSSSTADDGVYCVTVADNHTLLAGRNGKFQWVGQSLYGVSGDSNFRLFDWRVAEAITIAGRMLLEYGMDWLVEELSEYFDPGAVYTTHGDSVPSDEPIVIRRDAGSVAVEPAHKIHNLVKKGEQVEVWTERGWSEIHRSIEKPNRKQMYEVRTKQGTVRVTEDHSLVRSDGIEVSPEDVEVGDSLLTSDVVGAVPSNSGRGRMWSDEVAWLFGLFVADGTSNHYEYEHRSDKNTWSISNQDRERLQYAANALEDGWGIESTINDCRDSSGCWKLRPQNGWGDRFGTGGTTSGGRIELVEEFRDRCYVDGEKRVPPSILNGTDEEKEAFLAGYLEGDGGNLRYGVDDIPDEMTTKSRVLGTQLVMLLQDQGYEVTVDRQMRHGNTYYRLRAVTYQRGDPSEVTSIEAVDYDGDYVYDFETQNHHFHAGVGSVIVHNTDGFGLAVDHDLPRSSVLPLVEEVTEQLNEEEMPAFVEETFGVPSEETGHEVEIESYAPKLFIPAENGDPSNGGVKKTYAERITWDEGEEVDELDITGFEMVRSDIADVTAEVQRDVLEAIVYEEPLTAQETVYSRLREAVEAIESGEYPLDRLAQRKGMSKDPEEYGSPDRTPQPAFRGAKYAKKFVEGDRPSHASKAKLLYLDRIGVDCEEHPPVYVADTAEGGDRVDAIALEAVENLPECARVDRQTMIEKTLHSPLENIFGAMGWSWDDAIHDHEQSDLSNY